ncbi:hypothetical protein IBX65_00405 [Candidatus Aerophobetes bacterium]|nr:hypothetical protein [Candidatus Aerophobetes bacterium]
MKILWMDCEGPITLNDNAFEICQYFLPRGEHFFKVISAFDDYLADVIKKKGYFAGGTLKLIAPFLKAHSLSNEKIKKYSKESLKFVPGAKELLQKLTSKMKVFIISTSYNPYIQALCESVNFPPRDTFSTFLDLDSFPLIDNEREKLLQFYERINSLSLLPPAGKKDISSQEMKVIQELDKIFFKEIASMNFKAFMDKVNPVGGEEKERVVKKSMKKNKANPRDTAYAGDSITDARALRFVREKGGVSISFNGNVYALREAEFACISSHTYPLFLVIKKFEQGGKEAVLKIISSWPDSLGEEEKRELRLFAPDSIFAQVKEDNFPYLLKMSMQKRDRLRGEKIGELG